MTHITIYICDSRCKYFNIKPVTQKSSYPYHILWMYVYPAMRMTYWCHILCVPSILASLNQSLCLLLPRKWRLAKLAWPLEQGGEGAFCRYWDHIDACTFIMLWRIHDDHSPLPISKLARFALSGDWINLTNKKHCNVTYFQLRTFWYHNIPWGCSDL